MSARRVLVTGSRDWADPKVRGKFQAYADLARLEEVLAEYYREGAVLIHGAARGADRLAASWWTRRGGQVEPYPVTSAERDRSRGAGNVRNGRLVASGADVCLAFLLPGSRGAVDCADKADLAGIRTVRISAPVREGHERQEGRNDMGRANPGPKPAPVSASPAVAGTVTDLFGDPVVPAQRTRAPAGSNDMDLVRSVIATAMNDGYALTGPSRKVHREIGGGRIEPVPAYEAAMVHQLIDRKWLSEGGQHKYSHAAREGVGRSVLVPRSTKSTAAQWDALKPLQSGRAGHIRDAATGRAASTTKNTNRKE